MLEKLGVKVLLNSPVARIEKDEVFLKVGSIKAANIIWAAGIKAPALLKKEHPWEMLNFCFLYPK